MVSVSLQLALLSIITATLVDGRDIYCVKPQGHNCSSNYPCEDIHFYASNISRYFATNTILEFLPGDHRLVGVNISVRGISNLELTGDTSQCVPHIQIPPQILCSGDAGFVFQDVQNLTLSSLSLSDCGQPVPPALHVPVPDRVSRAALGFISIQNLQLQSITITNTSGYGVLTHNIYGKCSIRDCHLKLNRGSTKYVGGNMYMNYSDCPLQYTQKLIELSIVNSTFSLGRIGEGIMNDTVWSNTTTFATGVSVHLSCTNVTVFADNVTMTNNSNNRRLGYGGNMFVHFYSENMFISNSLHISNSKFLQGNSWVGGGLGVTLHVGALRKRYVKIPCDNVVLITDCTIDGNRASSGSGLYLDYLQQPSHNNCTARITVENTVFTFNVVEHLQPSTNVGVAMTIINAELGSISVANGITFALSLCNITVQKNSLIIPDYHRLESGSAAIHVRNFLQHLEIRDSLFQHNNVTGLSAFHSRVTFSGVSTFQNNIGVRGGGLIACESSNIILTPNTTINFIRNHAQMSGGGIYAEEQCANSVPLCFFQVDYNNTRCGSYDNVPQLVKNCSMRINMINNTADFAGSHIYGGSIDNCYFQTATRGPDFNDFKAIFNLESPPTDLSNVSSGAKVACFCHDSTCNQEFNTMAYPGGEVYPGENITVYMIVVGQLDGAVPGFIQANTSTSGRKGKYDTGLNCTPISFPALSRDYSETIYEFQVSFLSSKFSPKFTIGQSKYLHVTFKHCPKSYALNPSKGQYDCHGSWENVHCNFSNLSLTVFSPAWLGFLEGDIVYQDECPYDYCREEEVQLNITNGTFNQNIQCSPHRVGVLCGKCADGFSLSGISSACIDCTDHSAAYLAGYLATRIIFGVGLILLLTACNWTVTDGTLSGLLFYANVFKMNSSVFLPHKFNAITILLSWLNLDLQFTQCVYNGMDSYSKSWLAFVFPLYLWALVAAIIFLSRRFECIARLFTGNAVKVLATMIELSYAGLTQAVVTALSPITITAASGNTFLLWFYDGNIRYLQLKHFFLFTVGILFGILILIHTFVLLFVQPLQRYSNRRCLSWVAKLKPLIDAYTAPNIIKDRCRFWPGLLLLVRLLLIITFSLNTRGKADINLKAIAVACCCILAMGWSVGGVYKKTRLNILNSLSIINLGVLSILTLTWHNHVTIAYYSASLAVLTMFGVLGSHVLGRVRTLHRVWRRKKVLLLREPQDENSNLLPQLRDGD